MSEPRLIETYSFHKYKIIQASNSFSNIFTPGIRYMLFATLGLTTMQIFVKELVNFHVFEIVFFRSGITALFCMLYLRKRGISLIGKKQTLLIVRALFGITSMTLFFMTIQNIPFAAAVTLKYLSPFFTAIIAIILLKEKIKSIQWLFFLAALVGVFLLKGFDTRIDTLNLIYGIGGALFGGFVYALIRKIGESEHPMVIVNYFMLLAAILSGIAMIPYWKNPNLYEWGLLLGMGTFGYFGQVYMTKAFQIEPTSRVAPIKYMELVYALIIGLFWYGEAYSVISFCGILLILLSMLLNLKVKIES